MEVEGRRYKSKKNKNIVLKDIYIYKLKTLKCQL